MPRLLRVAGLIFSIIFLFSAIVLAAEEITITTYYPSPYGSYNELQLYPHTPAVTTCDDAHKGTMYYSSTDDQVYVCKGTTLSWQPVGGGSPSGAVMSFNLASCPSGWTELISARGRYIVGLPAGGTLGGTSGTALSNLENRPTGNHTHSLSMGFYSTGAVSSYPAMAWSDGGYAGVTGGTGYPADTNAPYIQLLTCQKN